MIKACVDVDYRDDHAVAACILFDQWQDATAGETLTVRIDEVAPYEPGQFYKRELPCLLAVLAQISEPLEMIVVDGYVWLADENHPGLGAHLYHALNQKIPVIGVAKTRFASATTSVEVYRGEKASRALYVTAVGIDVQEAGRLIGQMHGPNRLPTLLKQVDRLCRDSRPGESETPLGDRPAEMST